MLVHVLLFDSGTDNEGIHSLELNDKTVILAFEDKDDAERYSILLEAQDFPKPLVERLEFDEVKQFCDESNYEMKFVEAGFIPKSQEDRLSIAPPESNKDVSNWNKSVALDNEIRTANQSKDLKDNELENLRKRLEKLI